MSNEIGSLVFIAGAPGSGKSSVAAALAMELDSPIFEFGWIPEFRNTGDRRTSYEEDEAMAFENLALVAKNYVRHGFKNVIITDLENERIAQLGDVFGDCPYLIFTLRLVADAVLKARVLDETRSSQYRDWKRSLEINAALRGRAPLANETFLDIDDEPVSAIVRRIKERLG